MSNDQRAEILAAIAERRGGILRAEDVVLEAADPNHPLHDEFEWDDARAGAAHRIEQARSLIRSVKVVVHSGTTRLSVPLYVHVPQRPEQAGYIAMPRLRSDRDLAHEAILAEWEQVKARAERVRDIALGVGLEDDARRAQAILTALGPLAAAEGGVPEEAEVASATA